MNLITNIWDKFTSFIKKCYTKKVIREPISYEELERRMKFDDHTRNDI